MRAIYAFAAFTAAATLSAFCLASGPKPMKVTYRDVSAIFNKSCIGCHQGAKPAHGLDLTSYKMILKGDKEGAVALPGKPEKSRLVGVLTPGKKQMPPQPMKPLTAAERAKITAWVKSGAKP